MYQKVGKRSQSQTNSQEEQIPDKKSLQSQIENKKHQIEMADQKLSVYHKQYQKMMDSNTRNMKRLNRCKARFQQMLNHKNQPQYFLHICGFMNEYMQEFMLARDVEIMNINEEHNPDNMTYEQLLELGETIGKVSKGISKEEFDSLVRKKYKSYEYNCPICCTEFNSQQAAVVLNCKHFYHEECIGEWLKDENTCPICKKSLHEK